MIASIATSRSIDPKSRRGAAALVCAMTAAVVFLAIAGVAVRSSLRARQERKLEKDRLQLEFLCDAGVLRAEEQLAKSPEYAGETWLDCDSPHGTGHWKVSITISSDSTSTAGESPRNLTVTAEISDRTNSPPSIQRSRNVSLTRS